MRYLMGFTFWTAFVVHLNRVGNHVSLVLSEREAMPKVTHQPDAVV